VHLEVSEFYSFAYQHVKGITDNVIAFSNVTLHIDVALYMKTVPAPCPEGDTIVLKYVELQGFYVILYYYVELR
jgi:hypothetical protein